MLIIMHQQQHVVSGCARAKTVNRKKSDVQTIPGQMDQCLHEEIEEITTLLSRVNPSLEKGYPARGDDPA